MGLYYPDVINVGAWNTDAEGNLLVSNELTIPTLDIVADGLVIKPEWEENWNFGTSFATPKVSAEIVNFANYFIADINSKGTSVEDLPDSGYTPEDYGNIVDQLLQAISKDLEVTIENLDVVFSVPTLSSTIDANGVLPLQIEGIEKVFGYSIDRA